MGKQTKGQRTTPKKTDLEQRFEETAEAPPEVMQIPARPAQIKVQAINEDAILLTFVADDAMSVNNYTVAYEQWKAIVQGTLPWMEIERTPPEAESGLEVVTTGGLVGPDGRPL